MMVYEVAEDVVSNAVKEHCAPPFEAWITSLIDELADDSPRGSDCYAVSDQESQER